MTSVHGITVFGGTFPADIWHALYEGGEVPCEEFSEPEAAISWAPYFGRFTASAPRSGGSATTGEAGLDPEEERLGEEATGGYDPGNYDPDAYAPGAGQEPTPVPPPPAAGVGGGGAAPETGSE